MAKKADKTDKTDKAVKDLVKEVKKLRKENEKLGKTLDKSRKDQARANRELRDLIEERLTVTDTGDDLTEYRGIADENGGAATPAEDDVQEAPAEAQQDDQDEPEVTDAAKRRAKELGVDPTDVKGTGSGGRVLVKDVEAEAGQ